MIVSYRAPSSLNMSSYRAIWTHFRQNSMIFINLIFKNYLSELQISGYLPNPQEGGRLDAKRHHVIVAKALDGIWPVDHGCAVLPWGAAAAAEQEAIKMNKAPF